MMKRIDGQRKRLVYLMVMFFSVLLMTKVLNVNAAIKNVETEENESLIILDHTNVCVLSAQGKAYDGTSEAVVTATLSGNSISEGSLSFDAKYYTDDEEEYGSPTANVTANTIILSNLQVLEENKISKRYGFRNDQKILIAGDYEITANKDFLDFIGTESFGNITEESLGNEKIEIHWVNERTEIAKFGFQFAKAPDNLQKPVWQWEDSYTIDSDTPTIIFAKNKTTKAVSGPICVAADTNVPTVSLTLEKEADQKIYEGKNVYENNVEAMLAFEDTGRSSGIADIKVVLKNHQGEVTTNYTLENTIVSEKQRNIKLRDLEDGYYTLAAVVTDNVGNVSREAEVCFIKDSTAPEITINDENLIYNDGRTDPSIYTGGFLTVTIKELTLTTEIEKLITGNDWNDEYAVDWAWNVSDEDKDSGLVTYTLMIKFGKDEYNPEGIYQYNLFAEDSMGKISEAKTEKFMIDYTAPSFTVVYSNTSNNAYTGDDNKVYYNQDIIAKFLIQEEESFDDSLITLIVKNTSRDSLLESEEVIKWENGAASVINENFQLEHVEGTKIYKLLIKSVPENNNDGYSFCIEGKDKAGNILVPGTVENGEPDPALEVGILRAMDVTPPVLEHIVYDTAESFQSVGTKDYVNAPTTMTFVITEHNPISNQYSITSDLTDQKCRWTEKKPDTYTTELYVPMLGEKGDEQIITLEIADKAGNLAVSGKNTEFRSENNTKFESGQFTDQFTVDTIRPKIRLEYERFNPNRSNIEGVDYFNRPVTVRVFLEEHNFDESLLVQPVKKTNEKIVYKESRWINNGDEHVKTFTFSEDNQYWLSIIGTDNARNTLDLQKMDKVTAISGKNSTVKLKVAIDCTIPAIGDHVKPAVVIKSPKETNRTKDGHALFSKDVTYEIVVYDPLINNFASGIDNITFSVTGEDGTNAVCTVDKEGKIVNGKGVTITKFVRKTDNKYISLVKISSAVFNTNGIVLSVKAEDVATNEKKMTAAPIAIDATEPKAEISYDNNDISNDKYFHAERTATIMVTERNFSNDCFEFCVNGKQKELEFQLLSKGSGNGDDKIWTASYTFAQDDDYQIQCSLKDCAANTGNVLYSGAAPQEFTVDMTNPSVKIEFDNHNVFNESYYDTQRIATIIVTERNFNGDDVMIIGKATDAGSEVIYPNLSAWSSDGNVHRAVLTYAQDAFYTLDVEYEDLATNMANDVEEECFTVDTTDPELTIAGVENGMPYSDEVRPRIDFMDNNYDRYEAVLTRIEREHISVDVTEEIIGTIDVAIDVTGKGVGGKLVENIERLEENDGIYTLTVTVFDKAGRSTEKTVVYSINRFGSVYVYSGDLAAMLNGYHKKASGNLYITAYNADRLIDDSVKLEILCDGAVLSDIKSLSGVKTALQANNGGWFEYKFELCHDDFVNDGRYLIIISGKDMAGNMRTNNDNPIDFYIDSTEPMLDSVVGLEKTIVNADEHIIQYVISDAIALESVKIYVNGKLVDSINDCDGLTEYRGTFNIGTGIKQKIRIVAKDRAGNVMDTAAESFKTLYTFNDEITVSTNMFVRLYANSLLFWCSVAGTAMLLIAGIVFLHKFLRISRCYSSSS